MAKQYIKENDRVYTTGAYLVRDLSVQGGWRVDSIEEDTFFYKSDADFDGNRIEATGNSKPEKEWFIEKQ